MTLRTENEVVEQVSEFKFLGSYKTSNGDCTKEIKRRIGMAREKAAHLDNICRDRNISRKLKMHLIKSLIWSVFSYGVEGWTVKKSDENRIQAFEMWCWWRLLGVSWREHRTNDSILEELNIQRELLPRVKRLKFQYFGHVMRGSAGEMALTVMEGSMEGRRHRGAPRIQWKDNITNWSGQTLHQCKELVQDRLQWRRRIKDWSAPAAQPQVGGRHNR